MSVTAASTDRSSAVAASPQVDPRGMCFAAAVTAVVLAAVLVSESAVLLGLQAFVFAVGAFAGVRRSPY